MNATATFQPPCSELVDALLACTTRQCPVNAVTTQTRIRSQMSSSNCPLSLRLQLQLLISGSLSSDIYPSLARVMITSVTGTGTNSHGGYHIAISVCPQPVIPTHAHHRPCRRQFQTRGHHQLAIITIIASDAASAVSRHSRCSTYAYRHAFYTCHLPVQMLVVWLPPRRPRSPHGRGPTPCPHPPTSAS